jgi:hypothetical protein
MGRHAACVYREIGVILFLDFDGVLHPDPCTDAVELFQHAPRLAAVLDDFPEVGVVFSTSWRNVRPRQELLDPLPPSLQERVLGMTPRFNEFSTSPARVPYRRHAECEQWLKSQDMAHSPWLALDDRPDWFAPYCENLIICNSRRGFDQSVAARLASALEIARQRSARGLDLELA